MQWVESTLSACFLHCCWVSTAAFLGNHAGLGLAGVVPHTLLLSQGWRRTYRKHCSVPFTKKWQMNLLSPRVVTSSWSMHLQVKFLYVNGTYTSSIFLNTLPLFQWGMVLFAVGLLFLMLLKKKIILQVQYIRVSNVFYFFSGTITVLTLLPTCNLFLQCGICVVIQKSKVKILVTSTRVVQRFFTLLFCIITQVPHWRNRLQVGNKVRIVMIVLLVVGSLLQMGHFFWCPIGYLKMLKFLI